MADRNVEILREPCFWFAYYGWGFGQRGPVFDSKVLSRALHVSEDDGYRWWETFTGWYEGILDDSDGAVDDPATIEISLDGGESLLVEWHPGDLCVFQRRPSQIPDQDLIANFGPHWRLPDWSLAEAGARAGSNPFVLLILAPLIRIVTDEDRVAAQIAIANAWERSGVVTRDDAALLAQEWLRCALGRVDR